MKTFEEKFRSYATLAIRLGVNVQPHQLVVIDAPIQAAEFVRALVESAYDAGAKLVHIEWSDGEVERTKLIRSPLDALKEYPAWRAQGYTEMAKAGAAFIGINAPQPGLLSNVPTERIALVRRASAEALKEYRRYRMADKVTWLGIALPTEEWANQVFPEIRAEDRLPKLWETVFRVTRVDEENPLHAWDEHIQAIQSHLQQLNQAQYQRLRYTAPGTDLTIELPENHVWVGGGGTTDDGVFFVPNIPTEECFTAPLRTGVNGTVHSTKPLYYSGQLIDDFCITFKDGRIVDYTAKVGYETLQSIIETDEGSHYLGEVALVPNSSPISREGVTFYNTLFDENASCHLAIGMAYSMNIEKGTSMSQDELLERGVNQSLVHVDFMIGSPVLNIDAQLPSGEWIALFRQGEWA